MASTEASTEGSNIPEDYKKKKKKLQDSLPVQVLQREGTLNTDFCLLKPFCSENVAFLFILCTYFRYFLVVS